MDHRTAKSSQYHALDSCCEISYCFDSCGNSNINPEEISLGRKPGLATWIGGLAVTVQDKSGIPTMLRPERPVAREHRWSRHAGPELNPRKPTGA
ncbi:hypothetical protein RRG08_063270 [Elysia crispata]|uniref:Uncharacterized protein n=1 Tax=Elysia crispata TaxID=231223 RepID=A0AAE1CJN8_9GAST|nr:hypothetical protein RRG08_063270 [Elysia crispata]